MYFLSIMLYKGRKVFLRVTEKLFIMGKTHYKTKAKTLPELPESYFDEYTFFSDYFDNNKQVMLIVQAGTKKIVRANKAAIEFYGYSKEELCQKTVYDLQTLLPKKELDKRMKDALGHHSNRFELKHRLSNNEEKDIEAFANPVIIHGETFVIVTINDISQRKKAEEALLESEDRFKAFSSATNEAIFISYKGYCIDANEAACRMFGYSYEELLGIFGTDVIAPESKELVKKNMLSGYEKPYEAIAQRKDGSKFYVEIVGKMYNYKGKRTRITVVKDIDDRVKASMQLAENKANLEALIENTTDLIWSIDKELRLLTYNLAFKKKFESYIKKPLELNKSLFLYDSISNELHEKWIGYYKRAFIGERFNIVEQFTGNVSFEFSFNPIFDHNKVIGVAIYGRDITDRIKIEEALKKSERNFRLLFENSPLGTYIAEPNGTIIDINKKALEILGSPSKEASKKINILKFPPLIKTGYSDAFRKCVETGETKKFESQYLTKWGKNIFISSYIVPLKNSEGKTDTIYTLMEDTTERNFAIQALKESEQKLKEINKTKDIFFSIIAHDLRSPFNTMIGFSKLLNDNYDEFSEEERKKFINIIYTGTKDTFSLLENLLLWSRSQRGTIEYNPEKINLFLLVNKVIKTLKQQTKIKSITIFNKIHEYFFVFADNNMVSTIIRNLISNAIKFTHKGGVVTLSAGMTIVNNESFVKISVSDSGVGIPREDQAKLFELKEINSKKGTEGEKGSGLGLILCKEFVERHGGTIEVESEPGKGSTFSFTLPAG